MAGHYKQNRRNIGGKLRFPRRHGFWRKPALPLDYRHETA
jgi:hypothetical protein